MRHRQLRGRVSIRWWQLGGGAAHPSTCLDEKLLVYIWTKYCLMYWSRGPSSHLINRHPHCSGKRLLTWKVPNSICREGGGVISKVISILERPWGHKSFLTATAIIQDGFLSEIRSNLRSWGTEKPTAANSITWKVFEWKSPQGIVNSFRTSSQTAVVEMSASFIKT